MGESSEEDEESEEESDDDETGSSSDSEEGTVMVYDAGPQGPEHGPDARGSMRSPSKCLTLGTPLASFLEGE